MSRYQTPSKTIHSLSNPDLLVKNLRFLDLDEEFDKPKINNTTFSAADNVKNLNKRLFAAAWILYKLFELYDPEKTRNELKALFPPLEPKQSSLLRAAIFKRLYDLKLGGFFGKDVVVRKTMFDDCKGPKFEELLAVFSSAVLIEVTKQDETDRSIVSASLKEPSFGVDITTLSIVYQASLSKQLATRVALQRRLKKFSNTLRAQRDMLSQRQQQLEAVRPISDHKRIPSRTLARLRRLMKENWNGDDQWVEILLNGDQHTPQGRLLELPYDEVWDRASSDTLYAVRPQRNHSRLQLLEERCRDQRSRLDRWRSAQHAINRGKEESEKITAEPQPQKEWPRKYSLRSTSANAAGNTSRTHTNRPATAISSGTPAKNHDIDKSRSHRRSRSAAVSAKATAESTGTRIGISQRSRLEGRRSSGERNKTIAAQPVTPALPKNFQSMVAEQDEHSQTELDIDVITAESSEISDTFIHDDTQAARIVSSVLNAEPTPYMSLAERTRISMATLGQPETTPVPIRSAYNNSSNPADPIVTATDTGLLDLAERTRISMATMSLKHNGHQNSDRKTTKSRPSVSYPINQFETLRKPGGAANQSFFDETTIDFDEADIFKSRPRVALSPVLSPMDEDKVVPSMGTVLQDDSFKDDFS